MWFATGGGERLTDSGRFMAQTVTREGVQVVYEEFEDMPHLWPLMFRNWPQTHTLWKDWANACPGFVDGTSLDTKGALMRVENEGKCELDVRNLTELTLAQVKEYMVRYQERVKPFTGGESTKSML